jgi:hypothetical protein
VSSVTLDLTGITGYTDLIITVAGTYSLDDAIMLMRYNSDAGSNYSSTSMYGNGTNALSYRDTNSTGIQVGWYPYPSGGSTQANAIINVMNYSNSTTYKSNLARANTSATQGVAARVGLWRNTNPITSITLYMSAGNIAVGSTFTVYGIAAASVLSAKATGGTITYDISNGYVVHTFTSSGTFTPTSGSLNVEYLVVAGGGGGGYQQGGGGGAGGFRTATGYSATGATTVTVGAGGNAGSNGSNSVFGSITSNGGGSGGPVAGAGGGFGKPGNSGGSGGGGGMVYNSANTSSGGAGNTPSTSPSQGNNGGTATNGNIINDAVYYGCGGGGAGAAGADRFRGDSTGGSGGIGAISSISGKATYYAGGGGASNAGTGGLGGGGNANNPGTPNTGGGGGAENGGNGSGGSGIVIIRYLA